MTLSIMPAQERGPRGPTQKKFNPELSLSTSRARFIRLDARRVGVNQTRFVERRFPPIEDKRSTLNAIRKNAARFNRSVRRHPELTARADFWTSQMGQLRRDGKPRPIDIFVARALTHIEHRAEIAKNDSERDPLTKLYNRKGIQRRFAAEFSRADRTGSPISIVMTDLDHFKRLNDQYGHSCGDAVLRHTARHLRNFGRGHDTWGRHGGEEFIGILPGANTKQAVRAMERQRRHLPESINDGLTKEKKFKLHRDVTMSVGVATYDQRTYEEKFGTRPEQLRRILIQKGHDLSKMKLMTHKDRVTILKDAEKTRQQTILTYLTEEADQALYHAKESGRNRVSTTVYGRMSA